MKDPYLNAKNRLTLDVIIIAFFTIELSKNHLTFDEIFTLAKFHIWIQVLG